MGRSPPDPSFDSLWKIPESSQSHRLHSRHSHRLSRVDVPT